MWLWLKFIWKYYIVGCNHDYKLISNYKDPYMEYMHVYNYKCNKCSKTKTEWVTKSCNHKWVIIGDGYEGDDGAGMCAYNQYSKCTECGETKMETFI